MNLKRINNFFSLEKLTIQTFLRIIFIIIIFIFDFLSETHSNTNIIIIKLSFILVTIIISILLVLLIRYYEQKVILLYLQIIIDLSLTTSIIFLIQKTNFLITFLYLLSITNAAIILFRKGAIIAATLSTFLTIFVYYLMMKLNILILSYESLIKSSIYNLIAYFSFATIISILTESLAEKDKKIYFGEIELNIEKQIKNSVIDNIYSGVIVIDNKNEILFINYRGLEILGIKGYRGLDIEDLFTDFEDIKLNKKKEINYKNKIIGLTLTSLNDENMSIEGSILIFKDITEEVKIKELLITQERFAYIGKISASIAHEIRNPLASISASLQIIPRFIENNPQKVNRLIEIGLKEINRLNLLINDFLDYSRIDKLNIQEIDLKKVLIEINELYEYKEGENLIFKYHDLEKILINGDKDKLEQVFINLIKNGFEATKKNNKKILIETLIMNENYLILIQDEGDGIDNEIIENIFEPFFTTKKAGTGLGLSLVNKFISLHGGKIEVNSTIGKGTVFKIYFPMIKINEENL